ncbi:MAG: mandelate racemase/muconate lactonizing enzyme family protein [Microbacterium gubbeenense]
MTFRIARAEVYPLRFELGENRYGSSRGLVPARETTLVRLETGDGAVGWGESFGPSVAVVPLVREIVRDLEERDIDGPVPFVTRNALQNYHRGGGLHAAALSGVEMALWDVLGHTLGASVATLLGGRARDSVTPYASCGYNRVDRDLDHFAHDLAEDTRGFAGAKIKCGFGVREDEQRASTAREVLGDERALMVDLNGNCTADQALASIRAMSDSRLAWVEEPLAPEDVDGLSLLRGLGVPLATGEALYTRAPFRRLITERRVDFVQPDLTKVGGLAEAKFIAELSRTWGMRFSPHVWGGAVALAAAIQLLATVPDDPHTENVPEPLWLEYDRGDNALRDGLLVTPIVPVDGVIPISSKPGLGVEVDEQAVKSLRADR